MRGGISEASGGIAALMSSDGGYDVRAGLLEHEQDDARPWAVFVAHQRRDVGVLRTWTAWPTSAHAYRRAIAVGEDESSYCAAVVA